MKALTCSTGSMPAQRMQCHGACAAVALLTFVALMPVAGAAPGTSDQMEPPVVFDAAACYQLVNETGRKIAWARWEARAPESNVVARFDDDTPEWIVELTQRWIEDAYHWQASDDQPRSSDGAGAAELTTRETIVLWLRRIARQCNELHT
jgi:hypothetical protein